MKFYFFCLILIIIIYYVSSKSLKENFFIQNELLNKNIRHVKEKSFDNSNLINTSYEEVNSTLDSQTLTEENISKFIKETELKRRQIHEEQQKVAKEKLDYHLEKSEEKNNKMSSEYVKHKNNMEKKYKNAIKDAIRSSFNQNKITKKQKKKILGRIKKANNAKKLSRILRDIEVGPDTSELIKLINYTSDTLHVLRENNEYNTNFLDNLNKDSKNVQLKLNELELILKRNTQTDSDLINKSITGIAANNKGLIENSKNILKNTEILKTTNELITQTTESLKNDIELTENKFQNLNRNLNKRHQYLDCKLKNLSKKLDNVTESSKIRDLKLLKFTKELAEKNENLSKVRDCKIWKKNRCSIDKHEHENKIINDKQDYLIDKVANRIFLGPYYHNKKQQWRLGYYDLFKQKLISVRLT